MAKTKTSSGLRIPLAREGVPFIAAPLLIALICIAFGWWIASVPAFVAAGFATLFFRDPERVVPEGENLVVAPADGRVVGVERTDRGVKLAIFLSIFDVHINRSPVTGSVTASRHIAGAFRAAFRSDAGVSNERNELSVSTFAGDVTVTQIAGLIARRIVCRVRHGDRLDRGERFGLIRFGSRTEVLLPSSVEPIVAIGDRVRGGSSVIARFVTDGANEEPAR